MFIISDMLLTMSVYDSKTISKYVLVSDVRLIMGEYGKLDILFFAFFF